MNVLIKNVPNYEGLYVIDSLGNVVSLPKIDGSRFVNRYKILKTKVNRSGYVEVSLCKEGKQKTFLLHRLIALAFIPNPENYPCVNHKNGIKTDNRIDNLEWCSHSFNTLHAYENNLSGFREFCNAGLKKINYNSEYVAVKLIDGNGKEYSFGSVKEAADFIGTNRDNVTRSIRTGQKTHGFRAFGYKRTDICANGETSLL